MEEKQATIKVELIGGPLCGLIADWPEHQAILIFSKNYCRYEYEGLDEKAGKHTAIYRGWAEE